MSNVYFRLRFDLVYSLNTKQQKLLRSWGKFLTLKHVSSEFTIPIGIGIVDQNLNHVFILLTFLFIFQEIISAQTSLELTCTTSTCRMESGTLQKLRLRLD